jgi:hypothetical protein
MAPARTGCPTITAATSDEVGGTAPVGWSCLHKPDGSANAFCR